MPLSEGEVIAGYTIVRSLGAGGMGEVYLAQHPRLPRYDALKVLAASVCADSEYRQRFTREAEIAATLWHPHIVEIHDRGDVDGQLWIAMDYVEGTDAGELIEDEYTEGMPPDLVLRMIMAVAEALDYAHEKGLTHRDVKPANILIANAGASGERILLADFGIARRADDTSKLTGTNMTVGTVAYAAPEQLTGDRIDGRADQYALAATAYQLLTGSPPFQHSNPAVVISQHLTATPPPIGARRPELSSLGPVFDKALAKQPSDRFAKCVDFARALSHRLDPHASSAVGATTVSDATIMSRATPSRPRHAKAEAPKKSRTPLLVAGGAVVLVALLALCAYVLFGRGHSDEKVEAKPPPPQPSSSTSVALPQLPVIVVGADCDILGAAGITETGGQAYCAHVATSSQYVWSQISGELPSPTAGAGNVPVGICMEQTGASQADCVDGINRENTDPAANDTLTPTPTP